MFRNERELETGVELVLSENLNQGQNHERNQGCDS